MDQSTGGVKMRSAHREYCFYLAQQILAIPIARKFLKKAPLILTAVEHLSNRTGTGLSETPLVHGHEFYDDDEIESELLDAMVALQELPADLTQEYVARVFSVSACSYSPFCINTRSDEFLVEWWRELLDLGQRHQLPVLLKDSAFKVAAKTKRELWQELGRVYAHKDSFAEAAVFGDGYYNQIHTLRELHGKTVSRIVSYLSMWIRFLEAGE